MLVFFQAEDGIRDLVRSRGLGDVYKRQHGDRPVFERWNAGSRFQRQRATHHLGARNDFDRDGRLLQVGRDVHRGGLVLSLIHI